MTDTECSTCAGYGHIHVASTRWYDPELTIEEECPVCKGTGEQKTEETA